jgi:hypothetical protein
MFCDSLKVFEITSNAGHRLKIRIKDFLLKDMFFEQKNFTNHRQPLLSQ